MCRTSAGIIYSARISYYNIKQQPVNLPCRKDSSRVTFYDGGKFVPIASIDRRIRLLDVKSGKCEKTIVEHVGSVKSVYTDEKRGFVLSGSYDTTIRYVSIMRTFAVEKI